jgi:class 3 adenylate cyclase
MSHPHDWHPRSRRLEYTAIGDTTNTASRIEEMTKGRPHELLIAESTRQALISEIPDLVYVGELPVRGREASIKLWTLADEAVLEPGPETVVSPTDVVPTG